MVARSETPAPEVCRREELEQAVDELVEAIRKYLLLLVDGHWEQRGDST